jgi:protein-tyrosine phosphatase
MKHKVRRLGLDWEVDSAGTGGWHAGESPDPRTAHVAAAHGIDVSDQRARQFRRDDFDEFDKIYVMDQGNFHDVLAQAASSDEQEKVEMILEDKQVPDPYYDDDGFEQVYKMLDHACERIITKLQS